MFLFVILLLHGVVPYNTRSLRSGILSGQSDIAMSVSSIPTNCNHNKSSTDVSTTILWPLSE